MHLLFRTATQEYDFDAPVKLLDKMVHTMAETEEQQVWRSLFVSIVWKIHTKRKGGDRS